jgi:citrate synthase
MGFGHRVYKAGDPRARILRELAARACRLSGQGVWFDTAVRLHEVVSREKGLIPNVDFYSAPLFAALAIPVDLFVPVIAVARIAGWTAHLLEQYADNRLIRPRAEYVGAARRIFQPLASRVTAASDSR